MTLMERSVKLKLLDHEKKIWDHEDVAAADEDVDEVMAVGMAAVITEVARHFPKK